MTQLTPRIKLEYALLILMLGMVGASTSIGIQSDLPFWDWAWQRHHNPLSWSVRPWFLVIFAYFAYRHHIIGLIVVFISVLTSLYWFPESISTSPQIEAFLSMEQNFFLGKWDAGKIGIIAIPALCAGVLGYAFWVRSFMWGLIAANGIVISKIIWSVLHKREYGFSILPFVLSLAGLMICDLLIVRLHRKFEKKQPTPRFRYQPKNRFIINS